MAENAVVQCVPYSIAVLYFHQRLLETNADVLVQAVRQLVEYSNNCIVNRAKFINFASVFSFVNFKHFFRPFFIYGIGRRLILIPCKSCPGLTTNSHRSQWVPCGHRSGIIAGTPLSPPTAQSPIAHERHHLVYANPFEWLKPSHVMPLRQLL